MSVFFEEERKALEAISDRSLGISLIGSSGSISTFNPCEVEIDDTGMYVDDVDQFRRDPLRRKKMYDPAKMGKDQYYAALIPYGSSAYYEREWKRFQAILKKVQEPKGCAGIKTGKKATSKERARPALPCIAIRRKNGVVVERIFARTAA